MMLAVLVLAACEGEDGEPDAPISVEMYEVVGAHERRVRILLAEPAAATLACTGDDDSLLVTRDGASVHEILLMGLLGGVTYACTATAGTLSADVTFTIDPGSVAPLLPSGDVPEDALLLVGLFQIDAVVGDHFVTLVDSEGRARWEQAVPETGADLAVEWLGGGQLLWAGGGHPPELVTLTHESVFDASLSPELDAWYHHDIRLLDDNALLTLIETDDTDGDARWTGFEVRRIDMATSSVVWAWSSQDAYDDGLLAFPGGADRDPFHANSVSLETIDGAPTVVVNLRDTFQIFGIDPDSGALRWKLGQQGDFALVDADGAALGDEAWWTTSHAPELFGDKLLIFDNGGGREGVGTQVREYTVDFGALRATPVWSWTRERWHEGAWGDVDRLDPDTVLITENRRAVAVLTADSTEAWSIAAGEGRGMYRSERIDACELLVGRCY